MQNSKLPPSSRKQKLMKLLSVFIQFMALDFIFTCWNVEKKIDPIYS